MAVRFNSSPRIAANAMPAVPPISTVRTRAIRSSRWGLGAAVNTASSPLSSAMAAGHGGTP